MVCRGTSQGNGKQTSVDFSQGYGEGGKGCFSQGGQDGRQGWETSFLPGGYMKGPKFSTNQLCSVVSMPVQPVSSQWYQEHTSSWKNKIISFSFTIGEIPHSVGHSSFFFLLVAMLYTFSCAINLFVSFMFSCHFGYIIIYYNYYNYKFEFCNY